MKMETPMESPIEAMADKLIAEWSEALPDQPWDVIKKLMVTVAQDHNDIILLTNKQAEELMEKHNIPLPEGFSAGTIAGRVNPGLAILRASRSK